MKKQIFNVMEKLLPRTTVANLVPFFIHKNYHPTRISERYFFIIIYLMTEIPCLNKTKKILSINFSRIW